MSQDQPIDRVGQESVEELGCVCDARWRSSLHVQTVGEENSWPSWPGSTAFDCNYPSTGPLRPASLLNSVRQNNLLGLANPKQLGVLLFSCRNTPIWVILSPQTADHLESRQLSPPSDTILADTIMRIRLISGDQFLCKLCREVLLGFRDREWDFGMVSSFHQ